MIEIDALDGFEAQVDALSEALVGATGMAGGFHAEMVRVRDSLSETGKGAAKLEGALSRGLSRAIDGVVFDGMKLSDALGGIAKSMIGASYKAAVTPVKEHLSGMVMQGIDVVRSGIGHDERAVREALEGNLCRCTGYQNIVDAIMDVARNAPDSCGNGSVR